VIADPDPTGEPTRPKPRRQAAVIIGGVEPCPLLVLNGPPFEKHAMSTFDLKADVWATPKELDKSMLWREKSAA